LTPGSVDSSADYTTLFKELFCLAASDLADSIQIPLEGIGVLFEQIMSTGLGKPKTKVQSLFRRSNPTTFDNAGAEQGLGVPVFGRGQLLFLVRQVPKPESSRLQAVGYRFATVSNAVDFLSRSMEVRRTDLLLRLKGMQDFVSGERILNSGVNLACFALRPLFHRGFDVLVRKNARNMLPSCPLPISKLDQWQLDMLAEMNNWTVATCLERLRGKCLFGTQNEQNFNRQLYEGISELSDQIDNPFFSEARLVARPLPAPWGWDETFVIAFRVITTAHEYSSLLTNQYEFAPLRFFLCQQHTYKNSPDNAIFARRIHREMAAIAGCSRHRHTEDLKSRRNSGRPSFRRAQSAHSQGTTGSSPGRKSKNWSRMITGCGVMTHDNLSEKQLVQVKSGQRLGGVLVSNQIDVDITEVSMESQSPAVEMRSLPVFKAEAGVGDEEVETFAEKLLAITIDERKRQR